VLLWMKSELQTPALKSSGHNLTAAHAPQAMSTVIVKVI
jgi:hypothetical protein